MSEPTTEAGRRHLAKHAAIESCQPQLDAAVHRFAREDIAAIEAEARQQVEGDWEDRLDTMRLDIAEAESKTESLARRIEARVEAIKVGHEHRPDALCSPTFCLGGLRAAVLATIREEAK